VTKDSIRKEILSSRDILTESVRDMLSNTIIDNLINTKEYQEADLVFLYSSFRNEVDTVELIEDALKTGKRVALPYSYMSSGEPKMEFYTITSRTDLTQGYMGILEPDRRKSSVKKCDELPDVIIVPGVAFDLDMNRIGYGKGFYDSYFEKNGYTNDSMKPVLIGICYDFQTSYDIEADDNDIKMNMIITENGCIYG